MMMKRGLFGHNLFGFDLKERKTRKEMKHEMWSGMLSQYLHSVKDKQLDLKYVKDNGNRSTGLGNKGSCALIVSEGYFFQDVRVKS